MLASATPARNFGSLVRRRWWILPIVLLLLAGALAFKVLSAPLNVTASVGDGSKTIVRTATIVLRFNQDVDAASVESGMRITPLTIATVVAHDARTFEVKPWLQPDTASHLTPSGVHKAMGLVSSTYGIAF